MDLTTEELHSLQAVFREEACDQLDELAGLLEALPQLHGEGLAEAIRTCFRIAHNIKGTALSVGFPVVAELAHAAEAVFTQARESNRPLPAERVQALLDSSAVILDLIDGRPLDLSPADLVARLAAAPDGLGDRTAQQREVSIPDKAAVPGQEGEATVLDDCREKRPSVRVETRRLDQLMGHAGELLAARSLHARHLQGLEELRQELQRASDRLGRAERGVLEPVEAAVTTLLQAGEESRAKFGYLVETLHEDLKRVRMLPLEGEAPGWRRVVRDTARALGKQVRLDARVGDIELDRHVLDNLRDPFVHFLRNAVDHGLEPPDERSAAGKAATGTILITARLQGGMVHIEVSDDGRGLDLDRIGAVAVSKGIFSSDELETKTSQELLSLLFSPGFSTADRVSRISGRGVGLDVVRERIERLGGRVTLGASPELGGTTFVLLVPVSLLSTHGLLVRANQATFALPTDHISRVLFLDGAAVRDRNGGGTVDVDGEPIPLRRLAPVSDQSGDRPGARVPVVLVARGDFRLGLIVDEILSEQDFVSQHLPWNLRRIAGVNGALIQADGGLAVVVDVAALFEPQHTMQEAAPEVDEIPGEPTSQHALVVDDSLTSRMLERAMLTEAGYRVSLAADGAEAWELLQTGEVDLVVADVQMPRIDGFELTRMVRASESLKHLPVVLVTNLGSAKDIARGAAAGADAHLVKGTFDRGDLITAIKRLL